MPVEWMFGRGYKPDCRTKAQKDKAALILKFRATLNGVKPPNRSKRRK